MPPRPATAAHPVSRQLREFDTVFVAVREIGRAAVPAERQGRGMFADEDNAVFVVAGLNFRGQAVLQQQKRVEIDAPQQVHV